MNNTALRAETQSVSSTDIVFKNEDHEKFYYEKLEQARCQDCYYRALIYVLGISGDTRKHFSQIYDMKSGYIKTECLYQGWQTSGSIKVIRLAFNLYTDGTPGVTYFEGGGRQVSECRSYSVSDIFCSSYAVYFWEGIKLRYPEYCHRLKSVEEILEGMKDEVDARSLSEAERLLDLMSFLYHRRKTSYRELENRYGIKATAVTRAKNKLTDLFDVPFVNVSGRNGYIKVEDGWRPPMYSLTSRQEFSLIRVVNGYCTGRDIEILKTILIDFGHYRTYAFCLGGEHDYRRKD